MWQKLIKKWNEIMHAIKNFIKKQSKKTILISLVVIVVVIAGAIYYFTSHPDLSYLKFWQSGDKQAAEKAVKYINDNQLASSTVSLVSVSRESGLIKIKIKLGSTEFDSYISKDGKYLFPQALDISESTEPTEGSTTTTSAATCDELTKTDSPMLQAYVVSQCPYGLQMQRAMADAVARVPALANYIEARYIGAVSGNTITSMHGEEEATENLRQICIREEQPTKYWGYVACQIKAGDSKGCESSTGIDSSRLSACVADTSRGVAYATEDFTLSDTYGVSGSPTLILGDANVDESGFGGRSSDAVKEIICCASSTKPSFCSQTLNTASAASSYSESYAGSGSTTSSANCE